MTIADHELQIVITRLCDGRRAIRHVHLPTGIAVEDAVTADVPIIPRRIALEHQLAELVETSRQNR